MVRNVKLCGENLDFVIQRAADFEALTSETVTCQLSSLFALNILETFVFRWMVLTRLFYNMFSVTEWLLLSSRSSLAHQLKFQNLYHV